MAAGDYDLHEREGALATWHSADGQTEQWPALNDVVMGWGGSSRIVKLKLEVDQEPVGQFSCDGIILSTATAAPVMHYRMGVRSCIQRFVVLGLALFALIRWGHGRWWCRTAVELVALMRCHKELLLSVDDVKIVEPFKRGID